MRTKKPPDPLDQLIGRNVRFYRLKRGLSQSGLGASIGASYQQIQKYEKAANRVPASRLIQIARALRVPAAAFWGGDAEAAASETDPRLPGLPECRRRLMRAACSIADPRLLILAAELVELVSKLSPASHERD
jgi:transcriptional regulator with XRE-family HTH domain